MAEPPYSPYNFVAISGSPPERDAYPGLHRLGSETYSGRLVCDLEALTRLFTADHRQGDAQRRLSFLRNSQGDPILQGSSLKGMIRAIYEAAFPSCLPLAAAEGVSTKIARLPEGGLGPVKAPYHFSIPAGYDHSSCNRLDALCPACRLFGKIE